MGRRSLSILIIAVVALLASYIADRASTLSLLIKNKDPSQLASFSAFASYDIRFADKIRNCEDNILDETRGLAYLSCDPGRDQWNTVLGRFKDPRWKTGTIYYYEYALQMSGGSGEPRPLEITGWDPAARQQFHPLGIEMHEGSRTLFVINHDPDGPFIEQLQLSVDGKQATHIQTLKNELITAPNAIVPLSASEVLVTNDHQFPPRRSKFLNQLETYLAYPSGNVVHLNTKTGAATVLTSLPYANGMTLLNTTHLAVASTSTLSVFIYTMDSSSRALSLVKKIRVPFFVDNISTDSKGSLLMAGHPHPHPINVVASTNNLYDLDGEGTPGLLPQKDRPRAGSYVAEWDGNSAGTVKSLYTGIEYGTGASASRDVKRGVGILSGLYEKGILVWKE